MKSAEDRISGPAIDAYQQLKGAQQTVIDEFLEANPRKTLYAKRDIVNAWLIYTGIQGYTESIIDLVQRTFKE